ncbi:NUDIX hydrolase [Cytobacillus massiliigabonensis]|uniref:NUDIX hydrolase n=1 Tax=Cytobacillus massiliigabonensis TaxID=1871011 RepID=UPI000C819DF6|nr:NUDIX hydrolase [Cytobacillus massiliigabonensis]
MDATFHIKNAVFNVRVAGVMIENGHVLIHKQVSENHWALPGGRVEILENSQSCIIREMKEELDFDVKINRLLWMTENFFEYNCKHYHEIGFYYNISSVTSPFHFTTETFHGEEGNRLIYRWVPINELKQIPLFPEFLRTSLEDLPLTPKHLIFEQYS